MATSRFPYGDAYLVSTPAIDRVGAMMINDQKQREQAQAKQSQALDEQFAKNISAIRDADVPSLTQKWGEYKQLKQQLYNPKTKLSNDDRIALQMKAQGALGDVYSHINKSKQEKSDEEDYAKDVQKNPNNYNDNAHEWLMDRRKLPMDNFQSSSGGKSIDFTDIPKNIKYQLGTTDFSPLITKAKGQEVLRGQPNDIVSPDGLTTTRTQYKGVNSPSEYYKILSSGVVGSQKTKHLPLEFNYTDEEAADIMNNYEKLKQTPGFKAAYPNEPDLPATAFATPAGKTMAIMSMEHALLHPPTAVESKPFNNTGAVMAAKNKQQLLMNGLRFGQAKDLIALRHQYKDASAEDKVKDVDAFIDGEVVDAQNSTNDPIGNRGKVMKVSPNILAAFTQKDASTGHTFTPTEIHALYNGNFELVGAAPDGTNLEITRPEYRAALVNHVFNSPTKVNQIHTEKMLDTGKSTQVHTGYSRTDLKGAGWNDKQIDAAVKAGKIKLD